MSQADDLLRLILEQNARDVGGMGLQHVASGIPSYAPSPVPAQATEAAMPGAQAPVLTPAHLSLLQRLAMGVQVPNTPLSPNRGSARAQLFLRGLVGGFKNAEAGGIERILGGGGRGRSAGTMAGAGPSAMDALKEEYQRMVNEKYRRDMNAPDLKGERGIDQFTAEQARKEAESKALVGAREGSREAALARAARSGRPDAARAGGGGGGRGGGKGKGGATYAGERSQLGARARAELNRLHGIATQMAAARGLPLEQDTEARAFFARKQMEINEQLQALLRDLDARYSVTHNVAGGGAAAPTPANSDTGPRPGESFDAFAKRTQAQ